MRSALALLTALCFFAACGEESAPGPLDSGTPDIFFQQDTTVDAMTDVTEDVGTDATVDAVLEDLPPNDTTPDASTEDAQLEDSGSGTLEDIASDTALPDSVDDTAIPEDISEPDTAEVDTSQPLTLCEQYCILSDINCVDEYAIDFGPQPCLDQCGTWPEGNPGDTEGDSVQCRLYHLGAAAADPATHCPHASPDGGGVCIVPDYGNDAGNTCETAGTALLSPNINSGTTAGQTNSYTPGACGFTAGTSKDVAWILSPPMSGVYTFNLTTKQGGPSVLYVVENCNDISGTCSGFMNGLVDENLEAMLVAGQDYFIIVDGWNAGQAGEFDLEISPPCIPSCAPFQECGDDGCGGSCGTCNPNDPNGWTTCDPGTNTCVTPQESQANTCAKALPVNTLPFTFTGSTESATNNYGYGPSVCPGVDYHWGNGSKDHTFVIQPGQSAIYTIELEAEFDATLYVVGNCDNIDASCLAASETFGKESLVLELIAGVPYYVIVDGFANDYDESGTYTLHVAEPCVPTCGEGYCGSDGCGGECFCAGVAETCFENACCVPACDGIACGPLSDGCGGECGCSEGQQCGDEGTCTIAPMGEQCFNPYIVSQTPFSQAGSTANAMHDHTLPAGACGDGSPQLGLGAPDSVYVFTPELPGTYSINLTANYEASLYVLKDCGQPELGCMGYADLPGPKTIAVTLEANESVYLIVDGLNADGMNGGGYVLQVSAPCAPQCDGKQCGNDGCGGVCGECGPGGTCGDDQLCEYPAEVGDSCVTPFLIDALPYTNIGNTESASNQTSSQAPTCFEVGGASNDHLYQITSPGDGTLLVSVTGLEGFDPVLYARQSCEEIGDGVCIDGTIDDGTETLSLDVLEGEIWTIVVDGWNNNLNEAGLYEFSVDFSLAIPEAGETCDDATVLTTFPVTVTGDTTNATDDYATAQCSPAAFEGGADQVWVLQPSETGTYSFALSGALTMAYIVTDCAELAACQGFKSFFGDPAPSSVQLEAGNTYYLVVDGYAQWEFGEYSLTVTYEGDEPVEPESLVLINEVDYDQPGADSTEFVELYNPTNGAIATTGLYLVYINGATGLPYATVPLTELGSIEAGGYAVIGSQQVLDQVPLGVPKMAGPFSIQNGSPDAIALVAGDPIAPGAVAWDVFTYEGTIDELTDGSNWWVSEGDAGTDNNTGSLGRCPNGKDSGINGDDFAYADVSPGQMNPCDAAVETVSISDQGYTPLSLTISPGTKVQWTNNGGMTHTVTSVVGLTDDSLTFDPLDSQDIAPGASFSFTFTEPGIYHYRCALHPDMKGMVVVE